MSGRELNRCAKRFFPWGSRASILFKAWTLKVYLSVNRFLSVKHLQPTMSKVVVVLFPRLNDLPININVINLNYLSRTRHAILIEFSLPVRIQLFLEE